MQVCGFVDGLVGSTCLYPLFPLCFLFLFLDTDHSALGFRSGSLTHIHPHTTTSAGEYLKCVGEVVLTLFALRMGARESGRQRGED